jgi:signal transduction histidine kinase
MASAPGASIESLRERLEGAEAAADFGIIEFDMTQGVVRADAAAAALIGRHLLDDSTPTLAQWASHFAVEDRLRVHALFEASPPHGQTERVTVRLPGTDPKRPRQIELSVRALLDRGRLICVCRDVTRESSLEDARRRKAAAERALELKSKFLSHVSHELRTPLNSILGFSQLMMLDQAVPLPQAQRDRLELIRHSGQRLLGLIDQLLDIGRLERGQRTLKLRSVDVRSVVERTIAALEPMAQERGVELIVDIEPGHSRTVRADPLALEQVLTNLVSNGIKYNRERQGRVRVRFRAIDVGEFAVDDTGKGMTGEQIDQLFEPFNRLGAEATKVQGVGLGLVITKQLVEAMGGDIHVTSTAGLGTRFVFHLPLAKQPAPSDVGTLPLDLPSRWDTGQTYSVLYVEDDEVNQILMEQAFETQPDWQLQCADTGAEGLAKAMQGEPDLILLDMNLPDMSGLEVFRRIRSDPRSRHIRCVAVSADALPSQIDRALTEGFDDYWTKPIDLPHVIGRLKTLLRSTR